MRIYKQIANQMVKLIVLHLVLSQQLLNKFEVDSQKIIDYFDAYNRETKNGLRHLLGGSLFRF